MPGLRACYEDVLATPMSAPRFIDADLVFARLDSEDSIFELAFGDSIADVSVKDGKSRFAVVGAVRRRKVARN